MKYTKKTNEAILLLANNNKTRFETFLDFMKIEFEDIEIRLKFVAKIVKMYHITLNEKECLDIYEYFHEEIKERKICNILQLINK